MSSQPAPASPAPADRTLDRALVQGIAWTGAVRWVTQLLSWASTLVVARLLTPTDYGLVGMAMVYIGLAQIITEAGLYAAVVQQRDLREDQVALLAGLSVMLGVAVWAISLGLAGLIAWFYAEEAVQWILVLLSTVLLTRSLLVIPRGLLARDLEFRRVAWIDGAEAVALAAGTLVFALFGLGYWALALGYLLGSTAGTALYVRARPHRVSFPRDIASIRKAVTFGWQIVESQVAWFVYNNADFAIVGRVLGKAALGVYNFAWSIASIPADRIVGLMDRVTPAFFAAVQHDPAALQRYLRSLTEGLALLTLPACVGLALLAQDLVLVVLGEAWQSTIVPLRLLAAYAAFRSIISLTRQVLVATGQSKRNLAYNLVAAAVLPVVFLIGTRWGTVGVCLGWIVGYSAIALPTFVRAALRTTGMTWWAYGKCLWPAASATLVMMCAVLAIRPVLPVTWPDTLRLGAQIAAAVLTYVGVVLAAHRDRLRAISPLLAGQSRPTREIPQPAYRTTPAGPGLRLDPLRDGWRADATARTPRGRRSAGAAGGPASHGAILIVSVDTEEDNWHPARVGTTVDSIRELRRFATRLGGLGLRTTYFTTYQVASRPWAVELLREIRDGGRAEIGAHLHPWNTPPMEEPMAPRNSMLKNLPAGLQFAKVQRLTAALAEAFGGAPVAFRAGRFGLGPDAVSALCASGYQVDSSVTPFISWEATDDGPTFVGAPLDAYRIGPGRSVTLPDPAGPLVEIPVTCGYTRFASTRWPVLYRVLHARPARLSRLAGLASRSGVARLAMLSPETDSVRDMLALSHRALAGGVRHLQLFLHSPSLRPGLTPWTSTRADVDRLYAAIESFVEGLSRTVAVQCATVSEARVALGFGEPTLEPAAPLPAADA